MRYLTPNLVNTLSRSVKSEFIRGPPYSLLGLNQQFPGGCEDRARTQPPPILDTKRPIHVPELAAAFHYEVHVPG